MAPKLFEIAIAALPLPFPSEVSSFASVSVELLFEISFPAFSP